MREMKDSDVKWIAEIPSSWNVTKIKHHFRIGSGTTPKSDDYELWDGDIIWVTPADFKTDDIYVNQGHRNLSEKGFFSSSLELIPKGNIIFSKRAPIGQVVINSADLCTNQGCLTAIPKDDSDVRYYRYLMSISTEEFELVSGGTTFKEISANSFGNVRFPRPIYIEQKRIADYLDEKCSKIDSIMEKQQKIIEKLKEYKLSIITEAVTKGLNPNVEMKDSGISFIGDIPKSWKKCRLRNLGITQNGISKGGEFFGYGTPFVSYGDVYNNISLPNSLNGKIDVSQREIEQYSVKKGDVFFTRTSETIDEIGFSCVCENDIPDATFAGFLIRFRPYDDELYTGFAKYYFRSNHQRRYFVKEMNIVTRASLGQDLLKSMPVLIPPKEEQELIANYLDDKCKYIEESISQKSELISKLQNYKKSLIYEVVTGKKEV